MRVARIRKKMRFPSVFLSLGRTPQTGHRSARQQQRRRTMRRLIVEQLEDRRLMAVIDLASLTSSQGTTIFGADETDRSGFSVSSAGDVNGDGFDDMLIGAAFADAQGNTKSGAGDIYVIFGSTSTLATIDLATLGQIGMPAGITIFGAEAGDSTGTHLESAGDVNGDGFDDLIVGAYLADGLGNLTQSAGDTYLLFGGASLPTTINLAILGQPGQAAGIVLFGVDNNDQSGHSVSSAGDINGDGFDDLAIGARFADGPLNARYNSGGAFVIFGNVSLPATINLATLGQSGQPSGITIHGAAANDHAGTSVHNAGDVNGDGFDDLAIGAYLADAGSNKLDAGKAYLVFGGPSLPPMIDLAILGQAGQPAGVTILGTDADDKTGIAVSGSGDVNGDGFDDILIGASFGSGPLNSRGFSGDSYVIFGSVTLPTTIDLTTLGHPGFPSGSPSSEPMRMIEVVLPSTMLEMSMEMDSTTSLSEHPSAMRHRIPI